MDSERALAEALADRLAREPGLTTVWAASGLPDATRLLREAAVDVLVVAVDGEGWEVLRFLRRASREHPAVSIVTMSGDENEQRIAAAVRAGATSWVPKQVGVDRLAEVVRLADRGEAWMPPRTLRGVLSRLAVPDAAEEVDSQHAGLTLRERQILDFLAEGLDRQEIAARLDVSVNTVRTHIQHLLTKLGVHSVLEAVALALQQRAGGAP